MERADGDGADHAVGVGTARNDKDGGIEDVTKDSDKGSAWMRAHAAANRAADEWFYRLGYWVATHPKLTLVLNVVFVALCSIGFLNFKVVTDGEVLWVPANSLSKQHEALILTYFDEGADYALLLVESALEGGSVLKKDTVDTLWELNARVMDLETENGNTYTDLCTRDVDGVACEQPLRGITRFWGNDQAIYELILCFCTPLPVRKASVTNDADVLAAVDVSHYPDGQAVSLESVFGNSLNYDDAGRVVSASIFMQSYELELTANDNEEFREVREWENLFHGLIERIMGEDGEGDAGDAAISATVNLRYFTGRSLDDALAASVAGETFLFVITYIVMVIFITINLGRCGAGSVRSRTWLGLAGVIIIVLAGVAAYGLNSGFGIPFTTLSQILPFILIGIGVDDMIVIVSSFDHTDQALAVERRIALALKRCGVSITCASFSDLFANPANSAMEFAFLPVLTTPDTSMTNFFAFMLGSSTSLPAVEYFCLYAGTAILFDFCMQITAFVACLTMDTNRQRAGKMDWLCCFKEGARYAELEIEGSTEKADIKPLEIGELGDHRNDKNEEVVKLTAFGRFIKEKYTPFILSSKGKTLVLLGTVALLAAGIYGVTQATQGFDTIDLAPDNHHAKHYTSLAREYELEIDTQYLPLAIYTLQVDYTDISVQAQIQATDALMVEQRHVVGPITSWLAGFLVWAENSTSYSVHVGSSGSYSVYEDSATFYTALSEFTQTGDNSRFDSDLIYAADGTIEASTECEMIRISRTLMYLIDLTSTENGIRALKDSRKVAGESTLHPPPMAFSRFFIFSEQFLVIYDELILNYILALLAVAVLSVFVLGKFKIIALVCMTVVVIDVELLGFVYHWGLDVNSITAIELIMAVGLVVDYMVHIVHYFLHQHSGTPKDARIADGLGEIGPSVCVGAATTFLGILPMAFASNHIFRVFLKMFIIIIGFGFFHGVCFIPVALSLLPEDSPAANHARPEGGREKGLQVNVKQRKVVPDG